METRSEGRGATGRQTELLMEVLTCDSFIKIIQAEGCMIISDGSVIKNRLEHGVLLHDTANFL